MMRMRMTLVLLLSACGFAKQSLPPAPHGVAYAGGQWFDGTKFTSRTMYVADGVLHTTAPVRVDSTVDLAGGYVVPPFSDAHQHLLDPRIGLTIAAFIREGIFYVKDQGNAPIMRRIIDPALNKPNSFDYVSANQGWTSPGGHPVEVVQRGAQGGGPMAAFVRDSLDPGIVMQVDTREDIARRWPYFLAGKPDFVKIYLLRSEDYARLRNDPKAEGNRGIDPALIPEIVRLAHQSGLQVSAHVFTAHDFRVAVDAGVDQIAHLPGGRSTNPAPFLLTELDAANAAKHRVTVVTTVIQHGDSSVTDQIMRAQYAHNIGVLRKQGVPLLIGSDVIGGTAATEIRALARSGLFTNLDLLRIWSIVTPKSIFPQRRIGALADGYEANFLVLRGNPLVEIQATRNISMRVKAGRPF
jgi:Amidohydrolase family